MRSPIALFLAEFRAGSGSAAPVTDLVPVFRAGPSPDLVDPGPGLALAAPAIDVPTLPEVIPPDTAMPPSPPEPAAPALADVVAAMEADHAAALVAARQDWAAHEGAALAARFAAALEGVETRFADILAPMLEPFLARAAQLKALAELREALRVLLRGETGEHITVSGPADLLNALAAGHAGATGLVFIPSDTPDVTIATGDTLVRSRLGDWASRLEASLDDDNGDHA